MARRRIFNICQYEQNPITKEDLNFSEINIISALTHKSLSEWAYTYHDSDYYNIKDELSDRERVEKEYAVLLETDPDNKRIKDLTKDQYVEKYLVKRVGEKKPIHWHIVIKCDSNIEVSDIARWFGIPTNCIEFPNGRGTDAFLDCVRYLTHESEKCQDEGKTLYPDEQIKANFDWRTKLAEWLAKKAKYGKNLNDRDFVAREVAYSGMTLKTVRNQYPEVWVKDMVMLKKLRADYISNLPKPLNRINYYICGSGRSGKGLLSRAVARTIFPDRDDDEIFFEVGADNVSFEGYDGQPVIIWNDCRSFDLIKKLGNRENVFNVFDTHPTKQKQNIKFGSINLVNVVNIVNSVQDYVEFLDGLAGEYLSKGIQYEAEDKRQSYERFPVILPIYADYFEVLFNRGYFESWDDFTQFKREAMIKASLPKIARACNNNEDLQKRLEAKVLSPIVDKFMDSITTFPSEKTEEEIEKELFEDLGYGSLMNISNVETEEDVLEKRIKAACDDYFRKLKNIYEYEKCIFIAPSSILKSKYEAENLQTFKNISTVRYKTICGYDIFKHCDKYEEHTVELGIDNFIAKYTSFIGRTPKIDIYDLVDKMIEKAKKDDDILKLYEQQELEEEKKKQEEIKKIKRNESKSYLLNEIINKSYDSIEDFIKCWDEAKEMSEEEIQLEWKAKNYKHWHCSGMHENYYELAKELLDEQKELGTD